MARLRNLRQERFARLVAAGTEVAAAYIQAGYRAGVPDIAPPAGASMPLL